MTNFVRCSENSPNGQNVRRFCCVVCGAGLDYAGAMIRLLTGCLCALLLAPAAWAEGAWDAYHIAMWQPHTPRAMRALQGIGIDAAMLFAKSGVIDADRAAALRLAGSRIYLENIATDIFSPYHMASSSARFTAVRAAYARNPADPSVFERDPSLADPATMHILQARLADVVARMRDDRPLFYNLGDETGIAETGWAWDFDISPPALADFRRWLQVHYTSLAALNAQWGSDFASWEAVQPILTDAAIARADGNVSGWGDFKQWSDDAFATALRTGTDALHAADPQAISAIEGAQIPGWGGYDFARLARAVDLMEIYDYGHNIEIARAINPRLIVITTSFDASPEEHHRLWHEVLLGARGHVIWDGEDNFASPEGVLQSRALADGPTYRALRGPVPARIIASQPMQAQVAILASMPSYRIEWLLARKAETTSWTKRSVDDDYADTPWRVALDRAASGLAHLGIPATYLSPEMLAQGVPETIRLLILPRALALSDAEVAAIRQFVARGGVVQADGVAGMFDGHLRRRVQPALLGVAQETALTPALAKAGVVPMITVRDASGHPVRDVTVRLWRQGDVVLAGVQRDLDGKHVASGSERVVLTLGQAKQGTELQQALDLGRGMHFSLTLDPVIPAVVELR